MPSRLYGDVPFAMVPEWILFHPDLTDRAVRLWGVLARSANADGSLTPSRQKLAGRMKGCSVDSVDRAKRELVKVGAVVVIHRADPETGEPTTNDYRLIHDPREAEEIVSSTRTGAVGSRKAAATPSREVAGQVAAPPRHSMRAKPREEDLETGSPQAARARDLARQHWDRCLEAGRPTPVLKREGRGSPFMALAKIVESLLEAGHSEDDIVEALWTTTGGHTLQGLGVQLCKIAARRQVDEEAAVLPGRIPPPRSYCGDCEQGWTYAETGGVQRCQTCNAEVA